jgi:hypothetical protein
MYLSFYHLIINNKVSCKHSVIRVTGERVCVRCYNDLRIHYTTKLKNSLGKRCGEYFFFLKTQQVNHVCETPFLCREPYDHVKNMNIVGEHPHPG